MSVITGFFMIISGGVFRDVSIVISLHFVIEDLGFRVGSFFQELSVNQIQNLIAISIELTLDFGFVAFQ